LPFAIPIVLKNGASIEVCQFSTIMISHLSFALPVDFKNGAIVVQIHSSFRSPVKDVACQDAFNKRGEPSFWGCLVQLIQQVW